MNVCIEILSEAQFAGWMRMIEDCCYVSKVHLILSKIRHKMKPWAGQFDVCDKADNCASAIRLKTTRRRYEHISLARMDRMGKTPT